MDNTSVFQTDEPGSIPGTGSAGCVGKVSRWPHKPCIRVRVPYPLFRIALFRDISEEAAYCSNGVVAQLEEHLPCKQKAAGSKPVGSISPQKLIGKLRKGEQKMMYAMVCKQFRKEEERFWFCQECYFVMPASAKQIIPVTEEIRKDE